MRYTSFESSSLESSGSSNDESLPNQKIIEKAGFNHDRIILLNTASKKREEKGGRNLGNVLLIMITTKARVLHGRFFAVTMYCLSYLRSLFLHRL